MLLEIGFVEEMRSICGNKDVPRTFLHSSPLFAKVRFNPFDSVP